MDPQSVLTLASLVSTSLTLERQIRERLDAATTQRTSQFSVVQRVPNPNGFFTLFREYARSVPTPHVRGIGGTEIY